MWVSAPLAPRSLKAAGQRYRPTRYRPILMTGPQALFVTTLLLAAAAWCLFLWLARRID